MNLELSDEQTALRDTLRRYLTEKASLATYVRPQLDDKVAGADSVWRGLAAMGVTGLLVPEECDGAGMTMVEAGVVAEELGAALYPGPWLSTAVAATRALVRTGTDGNAVGLLNHIADGSAIATVASLSGPRPTAIDETRLHGSVDCVPDADDADVILVFAGEPDGIGLYSVDTSSAGLTMTPCASVDPTRVMADLVFDNAPARRLGPVSEDAMNAVVDDVVIAYAADALGAATAVMNLAIEYAKVRKQFDQPIGSFQAVQHLCVDMYEAVELARSGVIHALWAADAADPAERHLAALRAKAFAGRLTKVGDTAIQVFGGIGFTWEHDAHLYLKRLLGWSGFLGSPDRYLEEVGKGLQ
ncbi:acyl-CoA dehydrogenase family protein [Mycobacterium sp. NPDC051804]|uniref:acyl-CoA dehydrogenase family protein n=1 Tax=Mycobacterium sp. NPDC051804 TaxID=3364295 RepID=UPI0037A6ABD1